MVSGVAIALFDACLGRWVRGVDAEIQEPRPRGSRCDRALNLPDPIHVQQILPSSSTGARACMARVDGLVRDLLIGSRTGPLPGSLVSHPIRRVNVRRFTVLCFTVLWVDIGSRLDGWRGRHGTVVLRPTQFAGVPASSRYRRACRAIATRVDSGRSPAATAADGRA